MFMKEYLTLLNVPRLFGNGYNIECASIKFLSDLLLHNECN